VRASAASKLGDPSVSDFIIALVARRTRGIRIPKVSGRPSARGCANPPLNILAQIRAAACLRPVWDYRVIGLARDGARGRNQEQDGAADKAKSPRLRANASE